jgi:hypothetical protein
MTAVHVTPMEPQWFGVEVEEGDTTKGVRVRLTDGLVDDLQLGDIDPVAIVRESIAFLLDRTPGPALPEELSLDRVGAEHPDYYDELRARLAPSPERS